jgi:hypothetical protein
MFDASAHQGSFFFWVDINPIHTIDRVPRDLGVRRHLFAHFSCPEENKYFLAKVFSSFRAGAYKAV